MSHTNDSAVRLEPVSLGERPTHVSTTIFVLILAVPIVTCVLFGGVDAGTWALISLLTLTIVLLWLSEAWRSGGLLFNRDALPLPLAGLLAIGVVQLLPTPARSLDPYATRFFVIRLAAYLVFLVAAMAFVNSRGRIRKTAFAMILFGTAMAIFSILQRLADPTTILGVRDPGQAIPFGTFVNQHHFAAFMVMTTGLAFAQVFSSRHSREHRMIAAAAAFVMSVALVFTSSRGGLVALAVTLIVTFVYSYSQRKSSGTSRLRPLVLGAGIAAGGLILVVGSLLLLGGDASLERYAGTLTGGGDVSSGRTHFWGIAWQIFLHNPVFGAGLDAFGVAFPRFDTWDGTFRIEQAHNDYLQTLADAGIAGFACLLGFVILFVRKAMGTISLSGDHRRRSIAIGAFAGCLGILVHSFFDFPLRTPSNAFFFLLLAVLATGRLPETKTNVR